MRHLLPLCLMIAACSGPGTTTDAAVDLQATDLFVDGARSELGGPDTGTADATAIVDTSPADAALVTPEASPGCTYANVDEKLAECGGFYKLILQYTKQSGPGTCVSQYWVVKGETGQHASAAAAAAAGGCDGQCIWSKAMAVTMLRCGQKTGFIRWDATGCPSLFEFPGGWYPSVADFEAANPCPDAGH
jgi:hypothetical protein